MVTIRNDTTITASVNVTLADNDDLYVSRAALVASSGGNAVLAQYDYHQISVVGEVFGAGNGIMLGTMANNGAGTNNWIWVAPEGRVSSDGGAAILSFGAWTTFVNEGSISGSGLGVAGLQHTGDTLAFHNIGTLSGQDYGLYLAGSGSRVENDGTITSKKIGFQARPESPTTNSQIEVVNTGRISGRDGGYVAIEAQEGFVFTTTLINRGYISKVRLADGNDLYDGEGGKAGVVEGGNGNDTLGGGAWRDVFEGGGGDDSLDGAEGNDSLTGGAGADTLIGGEGNDVLLPGEGIDFIDGGAGDADLLDYNGSGGVVVDLATGRTLISHAYADTFTGIEGVAGGAANDTLYGDAGANGLRGRAGIDLIFGRGGSDQLSGDSGNDTLIGGVGTDMLRGGSGADVFSYGTLADAPAGTDLDPRAFDRIVDFSQAEGDRIDLRNLDANPGLAGDQAFSFIGTAAFSATGQARLYQLSGATYVYGNTDSDFSTNEFVISLSGGIILTAADFFL